MTTFGFLITLRVNDLQVGLETKFFHIAKDNILTTEEYRNSDTLLVYTLGSLEHFEYICFREYHTFWILAGTLLKDTDFAIATTEPVHKLFAVSIPVSNRLLSHSRFYSCFGNSRWYFIDKARVERLRDDIFFSESEVYSIYQIDLIRYCFLSQIRQGMYCGDLHFLIDLGSTYVQGTAEDEGESKDIVHLVRSIRTASSHDDILTSLDSQVIGNLRSRVGHSKNDRIFGHAKEHFGAYHISFRKSDKDIRILHGFF